MCLVPLAIVRIVSSMEEHLGGLLPELFPNKSSEGVRLLTEKLMDPAIGLETEDDLLRLKFEDLKQTGMTTVEARAIEMHILAEPRSSSTNDIDKEHAEHNQENKSHEELLRRDFARHMMELKQREESAKVMHNLEMKKLNMAEESPKVDLEIEMKIFKKSLESQKNEHDIEMKKLDSAAELSKKAYEVEMKEMYLSAVELYNKSNKSNVEETEKSENEEINTSSWTKTRKILAAIAGLTFYAWEGVSYLIK